MGWGGDQQIRFPACRGCFFLLSVLCVSFTREFGVGFRGSFLDRGQLKESVASRGQSVYVVDLVKGSILVLEVDLLFGSAL